MKIFYGFIVVFFIVVIGIIGYLYREHIPFLTTTYNKDNSKPIIKVYSESSKYDVSIEDYELLSQMILYSGFFEENAVGINTPGKDLQWITAKNLNIVFTDEEQPWGGIYSKEKRSSISSFGLQADENNTVALLIWIHGDKVSDDSFRPFLLNTFFSSLYTTTHWNDFVNSSADYTQYLYVLGKSIEKKELDSLFTITLK